MRKHSDYAWPMLEDCTGPAKYIASSIRVLGEVILDVAQLIAKDSLLKKNRSVEINSQGPLQAMKDLLNNQVDLSPEEASVLNDNFWELIGPSQSSAGGSLAHDPNERKPTAKAVGGIESVSDI